MDGYTHAIPFVDMRTSCPAGSSILAKSPRAIHCRARSSAFSQVQTGPVPSVGWNEITYGKVSAKGQLLGARRSSLPELQQLSQPSHRLPSAFSFERLMGFTLLSDTCWKCNGAHNCYEEKEAALSPRAGALGKERARPWSLSCILAAGALPWAPSLGAGHLPGGLTRQGANTCGSIQISRTK